MSKIAKGNKKYAQQMVWDLVPCDEAVETMSKVGLVPPSEDVMELEHERSHIRMNRTLQYEDRIEVMADIAADVILATSVGPDVVAKLSDAERAALKKSYAWMFEVTATAIIANLLDDQATARGRRG